MAVAAQGVPKAQVDGTEEILLNSKFPFKRLNSLFFPKPCGRVAGSPWQAELPWGLGEQDGALTGEE